MEARVKQLQRPPGNVCIPDRHSDHHSAGCQSVHSMHSMHSAQEHAHVRSLGHHAGSRGVLSDTTSEHERGGLRVTEVEASLARCCAVAYVPV